MDKKRYQCISELQDNLRKLYETINYSPEKISIKSPNGFLQAFNFAKRRMYAIYIKRLTGQVKEAIKIADGIRRDRWSEKEYQKELEKRIDSYEESVKSYVEKTDKQSNRIAELEGRLRNYELSQNGNIGTELRDMIGNIIALRDGQLIKRDLLYDQGEETGSVSLRIVEATLKETASLLKKSGVEILEDQGAFSSERQTIVDVKETEEESLDGQIAEVVRPGYIYQGEQLRGQEVIVYKLRG